MPKSYKIVWKQSAVKELKQIPPKMIGRIVADVENLSEDPHPPGTRKIIGTQNTYRIRIGDYRVIYQIIDQVLIIEILRVAHRKEVYR